MVCGVVVVQQQVKSSFWGMLVDIFALITALLNMISQGGFKVVLKQQQQNYSRTRTCSEDVWNCCDSNCKLQCTHICDRKTKLRIWTGKLSLLALSRSRFGWNRVCCELLSLNGNGEFTRWTNIYNKGSLLKVIIIIKQFEGFLAALTGSRPIYRTAFTLETYTTIRVV